MTAADLDSATLAGATVQITGNYQNGQDVLALPAQPIITGIFSAATGTLTLTGTATVAAYQTALRAVTYANTSDNPSTLARTVSFQANDGAALNNLSNTVTRTITVTAANDAPVLAGVEGSSLPYTENAAATAITSTLTVTDADSANLTGATVQITGNYQNGQDVLALPAQPNITGNFTAATGTLTLTGTATVAAYQTALRAVTYANTSDNPSTLARTVSFQANDGAALNNLSNTVTRTIAVTAVNDAPVVNLDVAGALTYTEQAGFVNLFGPAATVTDVDSATLESLTVTINSGFDAAFDTLELNTAGFTANFAAGTLTITRAGGTPADFTTALRNVRFRNTDDDPDDRNDGTANPSVADRTVQAVADDGPDTSSPQSRNLTITPVNDAPGAASPLPSTSSVRNTTLVSGTNAVTHPKVTRTIDFKAGSVDPDGLESAITVVPVSAVATTNVGRITLTAAGDLRYEPPFSTSLVSDTYGYQLTDGTTASSVITFTVNLTGDPIYVADQSPAPEDGTAARPFDTLADAIAVTAGHPIHIRRAPGDGTLTAGVTLASGDKLLGEGVALLSAQVGAPAGDTLFAAGTKPVLTASGIDVVTLAATTEVAGLSINPDGAANGLFGTNPTGSPCATRTSPTPARRPRRPGSSSARAAGSPSPAP